MDSPRVLELTGVPAALAMPEICANCGAAAGERVPVRKTFLRTPSDDPSYHVISGALVPFCGDCRRRHLAEVKSVPLLSRILMCFHSGSMIAAVFNAAAAVFCLVTLLPKMLSGDLADLFFFGGLTGFFAMVSYFMAKSAWNQTEHRAVPPLTSITSAFDFSDDRSDVFDAQRYVYTLRHAGFAEAFGALNQERVWKPKSREAKRASRWRSIVIAAFVIYVAVMIGWEFIDWLWT